MYNPTPLQENKITEYVMISTKILYKCSHEQIHTLQSLFNHTMFSQKCVVISIAISSICYHCKEKQIDPPYLHKTAYAHPPVLALDVGVVFITCNSCGNFDKDLGSNYNN